MTEAWIGSKPNEIKIPAEIATAVPKPAIDSKKPPKPQAMIKTMIRLSVEIAANMSWMVFIPPDSVVTLYANNAATITNMIGQIPMMIPSRAAVSVFGTDNLKLKIANKTVKTSPIIQARAADIRITPSEMISQIIGTNAIANLIHILYLHQKIL